jgi:hypothetical protein
MRSVAGAVNAETPIERRRTKVARGRSDRERAGESVHPAFEVVHA